MARSSMVARLTVVSAVGVSRTLVRAQSRWPAIEPSPAVSSRGGLPPTRTARQR